MLEPSDDLPSLSALQNKINQAKAPEAKESSAALEYSKDMSMAMRFLVELVAGVGVGAMLGYAFDEWLGTQPVGLVIGLALGLAAGIRNMLRSAKQVDKEQMTEEKK